MQNAPSVSVIIAARDAAPTLGRALEAIAAQELAEPFEVIVVDDGSRDQTAAIAGRFAPLVRLIRSGRSEGPGAARNRGVAAAGAPLLAFTDADCFPTTRWLARGLEALERADLVQGRVAPDPGTPRTPFDRSLEVDADGGFYQTANLFVRKETYEAAGGFRDWAIERPERRNWSPDRRRNRASRTPIGEDTLFAWSARRLGARSAYAPDALVYHAVVPGTLRDALADRWHWTRDMPGLAGLVPELREETFYHRWFFAHWTAQFDLAALAVLAALATRRKFWLLATVPYLERVYGEATTYRAGTESGGEGLRRAAVHASGAPVLSAATLAGFIAGTVEWRRLML